MFYVTASDSFLSGWGMAQGKTNRLVIEVETYQEATKVHNKLKARDEMKYVSIASKRPYYSAEKYYVSYVDVNSNSSWLK